MLKEPQNEGVKEVKTENVACPMVKSDVEYELPDLPEAPVFYPSAEEFADPMKYLDSIRTQAEPAGVIKIVPPKEWRCPFPIKANGDSFHFQTCVQSVDQLRHRHGPGTKFMQVLRHFHKTRGLPVPAEMTPFVDGRQVDLYSLYKDVEERGGVEAVEAGKRWGEVAVAIRIARNSASTHMVNRLREVYREYLEKYAQAVEQGLNPEDLPEEEQFVTVRKRFSGMRMSGASGNAGEEGGDEVETADSFGFGEGGFYSFHSFRRKAHDFRDKWFSGWNRSVTAEDVEREYWRVVDGGDLMLRVEYGNDLDASSHGSGFPTPENSRPEHQPYVDSPWNLNKLPLQSGSLLKYISPDGEISGVAAPWVYVGMLFSSFCWHNEDNYLYSINYMHHGAGKTWYGVPGQDAIKFENVFQSEVPELFEKDPKLLFKLCTMVAPRVLTERGVRVNHTVQHPGEFIVTMPQAYHAGFSHGFNCSEAVNFAPADWLPFGRASIQRYRAKKRSPVFSQERLVLTLAHRNLASDDPATPWVEAEILILFESEMALRRELVVAGDHSAVRCYCIPLDQSNMVRSSKEWIGGISEAEMPQCQRCLHWLYLSAVLDSRNPKKLSCSHPECVKALLNGEDISVAGRHLVMAYRFSMVELAGMMSRSTADLLLQARQLDASFMPLSDLGVANALAVWFGADSGTAAGAVKVSEMQSMRGGMRGAGPNGGSSDQAIGKGGANSAGMKRPGNIVPAPKAPSVPGKLYFGFCEEVIRALQKIVGEGGGEGNAEGRGLCKIDFDSTTNLPVTPIQVGHACVIEQLGEVQARQGWQDVDGNFYWPKGFRSRRTFPSMKQEGKCSYNCEVLEGDGGLPSFRVTSSEEPNAPIVMDSPALCWQQVMQRVNQIRASKRPKTG